MKEQACISPGAVKAMQAIAEVDAAMHRVREWREGIDKEIQKRKEHTMKFFAGKRRCSCPDHGIGTATIAERACHSGRGAPQVAGRVLIGTGRRPKTSFGSWIRGEGRFWRRIRKRHAVQWRRLGTARRGSVEISSRVRCQRKPLIPPRRVSLRLSHFRREPTCKPGTMS
ncbi:hypothetical protein L227DRAFT_96449 [Lentinus tigrinus ALCF2SS1-6]|uniref:Uncharacterized protein n=1 Tax=Lentinus tigrinus ALCF2SS1-6 TaxID=1328759 RepID=A0A5C2S8W8_9APHY|nr:hypothetical protein L227DRAFT_96449 [Lentinus tigrinus ALCF2SS1-6]